MDMNGNHNSFGGQRDTQVNNEAILDSLLGLLIPTAAWKVILMSFQMHCSWPTKAKMPVHSCCYSQCDYDDITHDYRSEQWLI